MGLYRCTFRTSPELLDALSECLFEAGAEGLEESTNGDSLTTYVPSPVHAEPLLAAFAVFRAYVARALPTETVPEPEVQAVEDAWQAKWLDALEPEQLTDRWILRPTSRKPAPAGERTLWFEPSASFGAGSHPTTKMAAEALEAFCSTTPGLSLLDVGSGNGVLALVALVSGAERAVGVDTNPVAAKAFKKNAELNGLSGRILSLEGTVDVIDGAFPLVVANIDTNTLIGLAPALSARLLPHGKLWLTGLLNEDAQRVTSAYEATGLVEEKRTEQAGWTLIRLRKGQATFGLGR